MFVLIKFFYVSLAAIAVSSPFVVHELGHFIAARCRVSINRSLGFGPVLFKYQGQKPSMLCGHFLGWLCWLSDDDPDSKIPPNDPNLLRNRLLLTGQL